MKVNYADILFFISILACLCTVYFCIDRIATVFERTLATCPGPLEAGDYYTPEE